MALTLLVFIGNLVICPVLLSNLTHDGLAVKARPGNGQRLSISLSPGIKGEMGG